MSLRHLLRRAWSDRRRYVFFRYVPDVQGPGSADPEITLLSRLAEVSPADRALLFPGRLAHPMYHRMRRGHARLLALHDGDTLTAYGWLQTWDPFRRKFGFLARDATMLGPYWTHPDCRGQGLYGRLLGHSLAVIDRKQPALIYTTPDNLASLRGIEKAGFAFVGEYDVALRLRWFVSHRTVREAQVNRDTPSD